jgi:hypothetical protein
MHDWTLVRIGFDWRDARVTIELEDSTFTVRTLIAEGVRELRVPKANEWGPSVSVNEVSEVEAEHGQGRRLCIEMQSGDVIQIVAERIALPDQ